MFHYLIRLETNLTHSFQDTVVPSHVTIQVRVKVAELHSCGLCNLDVKHVVSAFSGGLVRLFFVKIDLTSELILRDGLGGPG